MSYEDNYKDSLQETAELAIKFMECTDGIRQAIDRMKIDHNKGEVINPIDVMDAIEGNDYAVEIGRQIIELAKLNSYDEVLGMDIEAFEFAVDGMDSLEFKDVYNIENYIE